MSFRFRALVADGPSPIERVEVPLRTGLVALYGLNGAGKSRTLQTIRRLLADHQGPGCLVVDSNDTTLRELVANGRSAWREGRKDEEELLSVVDDFLVSAPWADRPDPGSQVGSAVLEMWAGARTSARWARRLDPAQPILEILDNAEYQCDPSGNLHLAVRMGPGTPELNRRALETAAVWRDIATELADIEITPDEYLGEILTPDEVCHAADRLEKPMFFTVLGPVAKLTDGFKQDPGNPPHVQATKAADRLEIWATLGGTVRLHRLTNNAPTWSPPVIAEDEHPDHQQVAQTTLKLFSRQSNELAGGYDGASEPLIAVDASGGTRPAQWAVDYANELSEGASELLSQLMPGAPALLCTLAPPETWFDGSALNWNAVDLTGQLVPVEEASGAQQRIIRLALSLFLPIAESRFYIDLDGPSGINAGGPTAIEAVHLLDEPEAGLHALAEENLVAALDSYGKAKNLMIVAATHSRAFLNNPDIPLVHVFRGADGRSRSQLVEFPQLERSDVLGVSRADLLQLYRTVLLVEGRHDEVILDELVGEHLRRRRILVVPLRGAKGLKTVVDLQILSDTLTTPVLTVLDRTRSDVIDKLWEDLETADPADGERVQELCEQHLGDDYSDEEGQIVSLARRLHERRELDRFQVFGLQAGDIIEYLPVQQLVPGAVSWSQLREEHRAHLEERPRNLFKDFKRFLADRYGTSFDDENLRRACAALTEVPDDFLALLGRLDSISGGWMR